MVDNKVSHAIKRIEEEIPWVDIKPYSDNLISLNLRIIEEEVGLEEVNKVIIKYGLDRLGWEINEGLL